MRPSKILPLIVPVQVEKKEDRDPPPSVMDNVIVTRELQVERKHFFIEFRENERGRFMRITEEAHGRRNTIIIPSTGLDDFMSAAGDVIQSAERVPAAS